MAFSINCSTVVMGKESNKELSALAKGSSLQLPE